MACHIRDRHRHRSWLVLSRYMTFQSQRSFSSFDRSLIIQSPHLPCIDTIFKSPAEAGKRTIVPPASETLSKEMLEPPEPIISPSSCAQAGYSNDVYNRFSGRVISARRCASTRRGGRAAMKRFPIASVGLTYSASQYRNEGPKVDTSSSKVDDSFVAIPDNSNRPGRRPCSSQPPVSCGANALSNSTTKLVEGPHMAGFERNSPSFNYSVDFPLPEQSTLPTSQIANGGILNPLATSYRPAQKKSGFTTHAGRYTDLTTPGNKEIPRTNFNTAIIDDDSKVGRIFSNTLEGYVDSRCEPLREEILQKIAKDAKVQEQSKSMNLNYQQDFRILRQEFAELKDQLLEMKTTSLDSLHKDLGVQEQSHLDYHHEIADLKHKLQESKQKFADERHKTDSLCLEIQALKQASSFTQGISAAAYNAIERTTATETETLSAASTNLEFTIPTENPLHNTRDVSSTAAPSPVSTKPELPILTKILVRARRKARRKARRAERRAERRMQLRIERHAIISAHLRKVADKVIRLDIQMPPRDDIIRLEELIKYKFVNVKNGMKALGINKTKIYGLDLIGDWSKHQIKDLQNRLTNADLRNYLVIKWRVLYEW